MASSAWAFVRPFEIDKGIQMAVATKDAEQKNEIALAEAQANLEQNKLLRPLQLEQQRQVVDHNAAIRPIQLAAAQLGLEQSQALSPLAVQQAKMNVDQQTYGAINAQIAFNADQIFKTVPVEPGESEDSVLKKYLGAVANTQDPAVKNALTQRISQMGVPLALQAMNRGDPTTAHNVLLAMNMGPTPTLEALKAMPPAQQYSTITGTQLTSQLPNPAVAIDNAKTANEIKVRGTPTGDGVLNATMQQVGRQTFAMHDLVTGYNHMLSESQKNGLPMTMTFQQYAAMFQTNKAEPVNSVSGPRNTTGPGGVPYK